MIISTENKALVWDQSKTKRDENIEKQVDKEVLEE